MDSLKKKQVFGLVYPFVLEYTKSKDFKLNRGRYIPWRFLGVHLTRHKSHK